MRRNHQKPDSHQPGLKPVAVPPHGPGPGPGPAPGKSHVSPKADQPQEHEESFKRKDVSAANSQQQRETSPVPSCVSMKSDCSNPRLVNFKDRLRCFEPVMGSKLADHAVSFVRIQRTVGKTLISSGFMITCPDG
ncbi:hypothetical protein PBY51_015381 [Eleginops maclovinus]|uniref:Uncharacterized protein n=1 Tax=Eleginops maclovinus TaxID=56733 RepID=A0AAN7X3F2_ELEMC|nr:hypothetical protein PBY51_015381 [Eleginops maclovinus]